jgi:hypothetical protein
MASFANGTALPNDGEHSAGFNLASRRQFCSRFVREVIQEATGIAPGNVETFESLLKRNPQHGLSFWRLWFFGRIPWQRETVTPASLLESPHLRIRGNTH